jgi:lipopolysaccharide transport system permease protein
MFSNFLDPSSWSLFLALTRRDLAQRYRGSLLGLLWAFVTPLSLLLVYAFVFRTVFQAKWQLAQVSGHASATALSLMISATLPEGLLFALNMFVGLLVLSAFGEVLGRAPRLVLDHPQLVRRVVFPLPLLGLVLSATAFVQTAMQFLVLIVVLVFALIVGQHADLPEGLRAFDVFLELLWRVPVAFLVLTCLLPMLLGIGWLLAAFGTYFRDIQYLTPAAMSFLMFLGPVFYPVASLPADIQPFVYLNPVTVIAEQVRLVLLQGAQIDLIAITCYLAFGTFFAGFSYVLFSRVRRGFADVL